MYPDCLPTPSLRDTPRRHAQGVPVPLRWQNELALPLPASRGASPTRIPFTPALHLPSCTHPCWRASPHLSKRLGNQGLDPKAATGPGRGGPKQQQPLIAQRPGWAPDSSSCLLTGLAALPSTSHLPVPMGQCHLLSPSGSRRSEGQPGRPGGSEVLLDRRASLRTGLLAT